ncbi:MAG: SDR family NAD(P)-dependent oxidoreductase [Cellvibrionales bacterium]|nr:SDR family NAD(P)-dependent oxidoreductase [Cellvibrionales bacterium]
MRKNVLITGGSGDIGHAICKRFAEEDYRVFFTYRNATSAQDTCRALKGEGHEAISLDVTDSNAVKNAQTMLSNTINQLDVLVNCAGTTQYIAPENFQKLDDVLFDQIMRTNVRAPFTMIKEFLPLLKIARGAVINITSIAAEIASGSNIAYCASKSALENMTRSIARTVAPDVRVLAVAPGLLKTQFTQGFDPDVFEKQIAQTPLKKLVEPKDVADSVLFAAEQSFVTGTTFAVDGGRPLGI